MKKSRFSDSQILAVLKQAESGIPVPELCREHGSSSATFYLYGFVLYIIDQGADSIRPIAAVSWQRAGKVVAVWRAAE